MPFEAATDHTCGHNHARCRFGAHDGHRTRHRIQLAEFLRQMQTAFGAVDQLAFVVNGWRLQWLPTTAMVERYHRRQMLRTHWTERFRAVWRMRNFGRNVNSAQTFDFVQIGECFIGRLPVDSNCKFSILASFILVLDTYASQLAVHVNSGI